MGQLCVVRMVRELEGAGLAVCAAGRTGETLDWCISHLYSYLSSVLLMSSSVIPAPGLENQGKAGIPEFCTGSFLSSLQGFQNINRIKFIQAYARPQHF